MGVPSDQGLFVSQPSHAPPPRALRIVTLIAQVAFGVFAMTMCLPSMPEWGALFGEPQSRVQLTLSAYMVSFGVFQLLYGPLSDRHGRKPVLLAGLALAAVGSVLAALAQTLTMLVVARTLLGAGAAAGMVVGRASVQDLFEGPERTRVMAYVGMAMGLSAPISTVLGGQMHTLWGWQSIFVTLALLALGLALLAWRVLPQPATVPAAAPAIPDRLHLLRGYQQLAREPVFLGYVVLLSLTVGTYYVFLGGAPLVLRGMGVGPAQLGWFIMVFPLTYIAGNFVTSRLAHRRNPHGLMAYGMALSLIGLGLMLVLGAMGWHSPWAFMAPLVLVGIGHGLLIPPSMVGTVGAIPALAGSAAALAGLSQQWVGAAGSYLVGWFPHDTATELAALMLAFTVCSLLPLWWVWVRSPR